VRGTGRALPALALVAALGVAAGAPANGIDKGSDRPPTSVPTPSGTLGLTSDGQSIWMTEWGACWRLTMTHLSRELGVRIHSGVSPQQAARRLATRAVFLLYETTPETLAAKDGCRNGILWRYYHPDG
jgi:hypothetical protein